LEEKFATPLRVISFGEYQKNFRNTSGPSIGQIRVQAQVYPDFFGAASKPWEKIRRAFSNDTCEGIYDRGSSEKDQTATDHGPKSGLTKAGALTLSAAKNQALTLTRIELLISFQSIPCEVEV